MRLEETMEIFLLLAAWLLAGFAIAWLMGAAASMGELSLIEPNPDQDALKSTGTSSTIELASGREESETSCAVSAATGTERRRVRRK
jgi:hypothetical protein